MRLHQAPSLSLAALLVVLGLSPSPFVERGWQRHPGAAPMPCSMYCVRAAQAAVFPLGCHEALSEPRAGTPHDLGRPGPLKTALRFTL